MNSPITGECAVECRRCGACCRIRGFVRVAAAEIDRIAAFLGMEARDFIGRYTRLALDRRSLWLIENEKGGCVFLRGNDCAIQPVKPLQCRTFPMLWRYPGAGEVCPAWREAEGKSQIPNPKSQ